MKPVKSKQIKKDVSIFLKILMFPHEQKQANKERTTIKKQKKQRNKETPKQTNERANKQTKHTSKTNKQNTKNRKTEKKKPTNSNKKKKKKIAIKLTIHDFQNTRLY